MTKLLNLKNYHEYTHSDAIREILNVVERSKLPNINNFLINEAPYDEYPEIDMSVVKAILLFPTMPHMDKVQEFLDHGILIMPISHLMFIPDVERKRLRWTAEKVTYDSLIKMFYKIAELTIKFLLSHNNNVHIIGVDEYGRVLTYKYLKHTKEFMLNHTAMHSSFSKGHLELLLEKLKEHDTTISLDSPDTPQYEVIDLPEIYKDYLLLSPTKS